MTRLIVHLSLLVALPAVLLTLHVALAFRVGSRLGARLGLASLVLPPAAPVLGYRAGARVLPTLWLLVAVGVAVTRALPP